jgi:3-oxoacyl-[acyl-carrier protein] reductase
MTTPTNPDVAIVTGGSRGIGRAVVAALVRDGWSVAFTYRADAAAAQAVEAEHAGRARAFVFELQDKARPDSLVRYVEAAMGPVSALVNNAGASYDGLLAMTPDAVWDELMETNAGGAFRCCRAVLPGMIARRRGSIVNVSSRSAVAGVAGQAAYSASKAAMIGMVRSLAREVGKRQIRVNCVVPGFVETDMTAGLDPEVQKSLRSTEILPAGTAPAHVAAVVAFLLSPGAGALTGQIINVDAGSSA